MQPRPLSEGNRFQRWYHAWAAPYYARMEPQVREQAELIDRFLYSRRGLGLWAGLVLAALGTAIGLVKAGMPALLAVAASLLVWLALPLLGLAAWITPTAFTRRHSARRALVMVLAGASVGGLIGFGAGHVARHGRLDPALLFDELATKLLVLAPAVLLGGLAFAGLFWAVARIRQQVLESELEKLTMQRERDASARQAAEARLKLLQGQIQPHFIFNTLSALQHWVDTGDARAGELLRSLTAFLRSSTELLGRDDASIDEEAAMLGHYLAIQQARLGPRLTSSIEIAPAVQGLRLPPGLLLTLVENAVEHGIAPALGGGRIDVSAHADGAHALMVVSNTGAALAPAWSEGVGLANCRQRLQHRWGDAAGVELVTTPRGTEARIRLPLDGVEPGGPDGA